MTTVTTEVNTSTWVEVTGTPIISAKHDILIRFGAGSTADGHVLKANTLYAASEAVYVKVPYLNVVGPYYITVSV